MELNLELEHTLVFAVEITKLTEAHENYRLPFDGVQALLQKHNITTGGTSRWTTLYHANNRLHIGTADALYDMDVDDVDESSTEEKGITGDEGTPSVGAPKEPQTEGMTPALEDERMAPVETKTFAGIEAKDIAQEQDGHEVSEDQQMSDVLASEEAGRAQGESGVGISAGEKIVQDDASQESPRVQEEDLAQSSMSMDIGNSVGSAPEGLEAHITPEEMVPDENTVDGGHEEMVPDENTVDRGIEEIGAPMTEEPMGSEESCRDEEDDLSQPPKATNMGNAVENDPAEVGVDMTPAQMQTAGAEGASDKLILRIPKRQRIDESEYIDEEDDHDDSTEGRSIVKKARRSSSAQTRVATWSLQADEARRGMSGSEDADEDGEEEMHVPSAKRKKTRRTSSGRRRIVSKATVEQEELDPTSQAGGTVTAEDDIPPERTSDGWETYETDDHCYACERLGIRCFRFRQPEKGRKRWSCFRCHKRKKQCSFNDGKSSGKPSQHRRKSQGPGKSVELVDEEEDKSQPDDIENEKEKKKAPEKKQAKDKHKAQEKKKGKDEGRKRRHSSTKPGNKSKQKQRQKASTPAAVEWKMKKEEKDVEWQTGIFHTSLILLSLSN